MGKSTEVLLTKVTEAGVRYITWKVLIKKRELNKKGCKLKHQSPSLNK